MTQSPADPYGKNRKKSSKVKSVGITATGIKHNGNFAARCTVVGQAPIQNLVKTVTDKGMRMEC